MNDLAPATKPDPLAHYREAGLLMDEASFRDLLALEGTSTITVREFKTDWLPANEALANLVAQTDLALRALDAARIPVKDVRISNGTVVLHLDQPPPAALAAQNTHRQRLTSGRMAQLAWFRCCFLMWELDLPPQASREVALIHSLRKELQRALGDAWTSSDLWPAESAAILEATAGV